MLLEKQRLLQIQTAWNLQMSKQWNSATLQEYIKEKRRYKELRPVIKLIAEDKQNVINPVIEAVGSILKNPDSNPTQKLYAMRFAKDCFQQGSPLFVSRTQQLLLPTIAKSLLQSIKKGKTQTGIQVADDQANFVLIMTQCLKNWGFFLDKMKIANDFTRIYKQLLNQGLSPSTSDKYFKDESESEFISRMNKSTGIVEKPPSSKNVSKQQPAKMDIKSQVQKILQQITKLEYSNEDSERIISKVNFLQDEFDQVLDSYIKNAANFDENYLNAAYEQVESAKRLVFKKINEKKQLETGRSKKSQEAIEYERLPDHVEFKKDDSDEEDEVIQKKQIPALIIPKELKTITEESESHPERALNNPPQAKKYAELENTIQLLTKQNIKLQKKLEQLKNHQLLESSNHLTKELMELKRVKFTMSEQLRQLQQQLKAQVYKAQTLVKPQSPASNMKQSRYEASLSRAPLPLQAEVHPHARHLMQFLNPENLTLFKLSVLNTSCVLYKSHNLTIKQMVKLTQRQGQLLLSVTLTYGLGFNCDFSTYFYNVSELDLWKKPIIKTSELEFTQQLIVKLIEIPPSLLLGRANCNQSIQFCVPILFINYLRSGQVTPEAFNLAFSNNSENIIESKVYTLDTGIICEPDYFLRYFEHATKGTLKDGNDIIRVAFLYTPEDKVLLLWIQISKNQKIKFKVLDLEGRGRYRLAKGLLESCIFLFTI